MASDPLARVKRATKKRRAGEDEYRAALLAAVDALEAAGAADPFAQVAAAAGVTRQTVRTVVGRARARRTV